MKEQIIKILKAELAMTKTPEYRQELESVLAYADTVDSSFEGNMALYNRAKAVASDTSPREQLYEAKLEYIAEVAKD